MKPPTVIAFMAGIGSALICVSLSGLLGPLGFVLGIGIALVVGTFLGLLLALDNS